MYKRYKHLIATNEGEIVIEGDSLSELLDNYWYECLQNNVLAQDNAVWSGSSYIPTVGSYIAHVCDAYKNGILSFLFIEPEAVFIEDIIARFGHERIVEITARDLIDWMDNLRKKQYSAQRMERDIHFFSRTLDFAVINGYIRKNPFKEIYFADRDKSEMKWEKSVSLHAIRNLLPRIPDSRTRYLAGMLSYTGLRMDEILALRWENIHFDENTILVECRVVLSEKSELRTIRKRLIPLPEPLKRLLESGADSGFIFHAFSDSTGQVLLSYQEYKLIWNDLLESFSLDGIGPDSIRNKCIEEWHVAGMPPETIKYILGSAPDENIDNRFKDQIKLDLQSILSIMNGASDAH